MALLPYDQAIKKLLDGVVGTSVEVLTLDQLLGRVLAEPIIAPRAQPPEPMSAMDGYAVRNADVCDGHAVLTLIGEAAAGTRYSGTIGAGQAVRIFTGGVLPAGADRVVIQENVEREGDLVKINEPQTGSTHIRPAGLDFGAGDVLVEAGTRLSPLHIALAASANLSSVSVFKRPAVGVFASGDELLEPGKAEPTPEQLINSGSYAVRALAEKWGAHGVYCGILADDQASCEKALSDALAGPPDLLVTIGGASVGDYDVLRPAVAAVGGEMAFEKVAVKPGKPTWHARFPNGKMLLGLPGNPASALVCAHLFLGPLLRRMSGYAGPAFEMTQATVSEPIASNGPRESFLRGCASFEGGQLNVSAYQRQDSSLLTPFASANVLIRRPPNAHTLEEGALCDVLLIGPLAG